MGSGRSAEVASKRLRPSGCQSGSGDVGAMPNFQRQAVRNASAPALDTRTPASGESSAGCASIAVAALSHVRVLCHDDFCPASERGGCAERPHLLTTA